MKKILIVDDNPSNNNKYIEEVKKCYVVTPVFKLVSAKRNVLHNNYDYIVIDVMMPTEILDTDKELLTGFFFYRDVLKKLGLKAKIIFWSRLEKDAFDDFFQKKPENVFFLHKAKSSDHLLNYITSLDKRK